MVVVVRVGTVVRGTALTHG